MGDLRAAVQESWARAVLAASSVEEQAQELAGRITQSFQEGPLSPDNAHKLLAEMAGKLREHRRQVQAQVEDAVRRGVDRLRPAHIGVKLAEAVLAEAARAGYDPLFILALVSVESRFRLKVASERGAYGLVQLKPSTFAWISAREPDLGGEDLDVADDPVVDV